MFGVPGREFIRGAPRGGLALGAPPNEFGVYDIKSVENGLQNLTGVDHG